MKGKTFKYIIILAVISVAGVFLIQFGFLKTYYKFSEKQFSESTGVALKEVAWQLLLTAGNTSSFDSLSPVEMISNNYYLVHLQAVIDKEILKTELIDQFKRHEIYTDFEFSIFNPELEQMEDGILIKDGQEFPSEFGFQVDDRYSSFFVVHFPNQFSYFFSQLSVWYFFTALLVIVLIFFAYTLSVIVRQRRLSEVQKNFINNLTHELKTPISSIGLAASVINDPDILKSPERLFLYAGIIEEQNKRLSKNVEKVLNLASIEKNRIHLNIEEINMNGLINEVIAHFKQSNFGQKAHVYTILPAEEFIVFGDRFHLSNLMMNILENGVKYCEKEPELKVTIRRHMGNTEVAFADNGIGIPKDQRKKIFTKFYRVPTGNVHNVKGFGLGLDYVNKIVVTHKWEIRVDENTGGGTIFTLLIPNKK